MERKQSILEKTVQALDLPSDVAGLPRIELLGDQELRVAKIYKKEWARMDQENGKDK